MSEANQQRRCGYIAIVGKPNVGKSTLLNLLMGQKLSATSRKPQTTRHRILGIKSSGDAQLIFVDTPGLHHGRHKAINRYMNKTVHSAIQDVDLILFMVDGMKFSGADEKVLEALAKARAPVLLLLNKIDLLEDKEQLLPCIDEVRKRFAFSEIFPLSALKGHNVRELEESVRSYLPPGDFVFPEDQITDRNMRFLAAEFIREKIIRLTGDELPYQTAVEIEEYKKTSKVVHLSALILVEKPQQRKIVVGGNGERLKLIGSEARKDLEALLDCKVMLNLWVKVKSGWSDSERMLQSLGYEDFS